MLAELASDFASPGTCVYELGCAYGSMLPALHSQVSDSVKFVVTDRSEDIIRRCRRSLDAVASQREVEARRANLDEPIAIRNASVVAMVGALQDVRPLHRAPLMADIHRGLRDGGCLLLVEATLGSSSLLNNLFAGHRTKRVRGAGSPDDAGEALWGVSPALVPNAFSEEHDLMVRAGFRSVALFFAWYGVSGFVAVK